MSECGQRIEALQDENGVIENAEYSECAFHHCSFTGTALRNVVFANCVFEDCAFRNVSFRESAMLNGAFRRCVLVGLDWSVVRRHGPRLPILTEMRSCTVRYNTFIDVPMAKMDFSESELRDCYFQDCLLKQADFRKCDLPDTVFLNCSLGGADFREARNYRINVLNNTVTKAKFSQADAIGLLSGFDIILEP